MEERIELKRHVRGWLDSKAKAYLEIQPLAQTGEGSIDIYFSINDAPRDGIVEADCILTLEELEQVGKAIRNIVHKIKKGHIRELPRHEYCKGCSFSDFGNEICSYHGECAALNQAGNRGGAAA